MVKLSKALGGIEPAPDAKVSFNIRPNWFDRIRRTVKMLMMFGTNRVVVVVNYIYLNIATLQEWPANDWLLTRKFRAYCTAWICRRKGGRRLFTGLGGIHAEMSYIIGAGSGSQKLESGSA